MITYDPTPPHITRELAQLTERLTIAENQIAKLQQCARNVANSVDAIDMVDLSGCYGGTD